ncbi:MAG: trypsin-like peptidase domain-containing protein, partial [Bacilli bacterium]
MEFKKDIKNGVIYLLIFFVGCLTMYGVFRYFPVAVTENITKTEKDVTVTDKGIADAVEKVYDSVLVVSTYKSNKMISAGTGFIYKKDNNKYYILTNYHVIESGDKVNVTFTDGEIIETTIVGYDQYADIAILSFESKKDITIASLGKSEETRVGDTTFAVGAPLDSAYSWTVTRGIVSGKDRMVEVTIGSSHNNDYVMKVLQTDSAINSGNSGGPLCNSNGEVIGITSLKLVSDGIEGMGFAIPIETALAKAENIISGKVANNPYIGVAMLDLSTAYYYQQFNDLIKKSNVTAGVIISDVEKDGSAEKAGIKPGDIIVKINNDEVKNIAYLRYNLYKYNVGDTINVVLFRD